MATLYQIIKEMQLSELDWNDAEIHVDDYARLFPTDESDEFSFSACGNQYSISSK